MAEEMGVQGIQRVYTALADQQRQAQEDAAVEYEHEHGEAVEDEMDALRGRVADLEAALGEIAVQTSERWTRNLARTALDKSA